MPAEFDEKPYALTTVDRVKWQVRKKTADATQDNYLAFLIAAYSRTIGRFVDRQFLGIDPGSLTATSAKSFSYDGSGYLSLSPYEAREIVSVSIDGVAVDADKRHGLPRQKTTEGTFLSLELPTKSDTTTVVEVVAKWGIAEVPEDAELACITAVAERYRSPEGGRTVTNDGLDLDESADAGALPPGARKLLAGLMRR